MTSYDDARAAARRRLPRSVFEFVDGGAGGEVTLRENRTAFERVGFDPRALVDVSQRDTSTTVLGERVSMPILLAPAGLARLAHEDGELGTARAAGAAGTIFCISTASSYTIEEIADAATGPLWFQLYLWRDDRTVAGLVDRARAAGCTALVVTVDVPVVGNRERDARNGVPLRPTLATALSRPAWTLRRLRAGAVGFANFADPVSGDVARVAASIAGDLGAATATWERLDWIRRIWDGPLAVKGILGPDDAREAVARGADAVYVSNHGGRQLDGSPATLDVLPAIVDAVAGRAEVLLDGGVRRGEDAVKARALGAVACLVGRPWFHALGAGGEASVARVLATLKSDVDRTLALVGVPRIDAVDTRIVRAQTFLASNERSVDTSRR